MPMLLTQCKKKSLERYNIQASVSWFNLLHQLALLAWGTLQPMLLQIYPTWWISFVDKGTSVSGYPLTHTSDHITWLESKICQTYHVIPRWWVHRSQLHRQFFFPQKKDFKDGLIDLNNSLSLFYWLLNSSKNFEICCIKFF